MQVGFLLKKNLLFFKFTIAVLIAMGLIFLGQVKVHAETGFVDLVFKIDNKEYTSKSIKKKLDVPPLVENGTTLVPFRAILEELGYSIEWDPTDSSITATSDVSTIKLKVKSANAEVNGESKELTVAPKIVDSRTVVPLRFLSENSGATVVWDGETKTIYITRVGQYDTGKVMFYEKTKDKNTVYVYDGKDILVIPLVDQEIVNWYSYKGQVLLTMFDKSKNNNSFRIFRNNNFETLIDNFDIKDAFEYNNNLMIHGYDRNQKFDKLCRFDGQNFYVVKDNFYVGKRFIFKDKLVINKYDNNRNYTLLAFDKSSWEPGILRDGFVISDYIMDNNYAYMKGVWQEGSKKPLATFDGNSINASSFNIKHEDLDVDINNVAIFNGNLFAVYKGELVVIDNNRLDKVMFEYPSTAYNMKHPVNLIKIYKDKLYIGVSSNKAECYLSYVKVNQPTTVPSVNGIVIELNNKFDSKVDSTVYTNTSNNITYFLIKGNIYRYLINQFIPAEFRIESDKFLMLGKDTNTNDQVLYTFDGTTTKKAVDVLKINNTVSVGGNTFIDVRDRNRITNTERNTMLLYNGASITNLVVGSETKKWSNVGNSLIFAGYESDIQRNKVYSYGTSFNEQLGNYDVSYWEMLADKLFVSGVNKDKNINELYKFVNDNKTLIKDNLQTSKIIKAKGNYYFVDGYVKDTTSPLKDQRVLYIYDEASGRFIEMKVNLQISNMIFIQ